MHSATLNRVRGFLEAMRAPVDMIVDLENVIKAIGAEVVISQQLTLAMPELDPTPLEQMIAAKRMTSIIDQTKENKKPRKIVTETPITQLPDMQKIELVEEKPAIDKKAANGKIASMRDEHLDDVKRRLANNETLKDIGAHYAPHVTAPYQMALAYCKKHDLDATPAGREELRQKLGEKKPDDEDPASILEADTIESGEVKDIARVAVVPNHKKTLGLKIHDRANIVSMLAANQSLAHIASSYLVSVDELKDFIAEHMPEKWRRIKEQLAKEAFQRENPKAAMSRKDALMAVSSLAGKVDFGDAPYGGKK